MAEKTDANVMSGMGVVEVRDADGNLKQSVTFENLITDAGDAYYGAKAIAAISPSTSAAPTPVTGMKLGSGSTAASKAGAGAALVTYVTGSNVAFDATYPQTANLGSGLGVNAIYRATWAAGVGTGSIAELVIVTDAGTNATSTAGNTIARAVLGSAVTKTATDSLTITWNHKFLGA